MKRHIKSGVVGLGVLTLVVTGIGAAPVALAAGTGLEISVSFDAPLHPGDWITVTGTGFEPGEYGTGECILEWVPDETGGAWEVRDCSPSSWGNTVTVGSDGVYTDQIPATQAIQLGPTPTLTVTPNGYLADGQIVTVTGTDFPSYSNVFDCQNPQGGQVCGVAVYRGTGMSDYVAFATDELQGAFATDWSPPRYVIGQSVSQQLEAILLTGSATPDGSPFATNVDQVTAPINPDTGAFSTQYRVHRWLDFTDVAYAIEGHPEPVWGQTWPPPDGVVLYDYTFDCANMPAKQADRTIEEPYCNVVVMEPQGTGNWGMQQVTFDNKWLTVTPDAHARLLKGSKQVQVSGVTTCSDPTAVHLEGTLAQTTRRGVVVQAIVRADVTCNGTTGWTVTTYTANGKFVAGTATLTLDATSPGFTSVTGAQSPVTLVTIR